MQATTNMDYYAVYFLQFKIYVYRKERYSNVKWFSLGNNTILKNRKLILLLAFLFY